MRCTLSTSSSFLRDLDILSCRFVGQINPTDFFTRLLCSIVYTGLAPQTFYAEPRGNEEHFDGLPVDFVSKIITTTALAERSGISTYHVVNPHWSDLAQICQKKCDVFRVYLIPFLDPSTIKRVEFRR